MPAPITRAQREQILALHRQGMSRNAIAREIPVSQSTVTKVCNQGGLTFDRSQTEKATASKQADDKAIRAIVASDALNVAKLATAILHGRLTENPDEIPSKDLATIAGIFTDKHVVLAKLDADNTDSGAAVDKWLEFMMGGTGGS